MMALLTPVAALTTPPLAVAVSDGAQFASMALLAVVLAAASVVTRRWPRPDDGGGRHPDLGATRVR